MKIVIYRV